jgi:hypothetical protein
MAQLEPAEVVLKAEAAPLAAVLEVAVVGPALPAPPASDTHHQPEPAQLAVLPTVPVALEALRAGVVAQQEHQPTMLASLEHYSPSVEKKAAGRAQRHRSSPLGVTVTNSQN